LAQNILSKAERAKIELLKRRAWSDYYVFAKFVAGNSLMQDLPHRELCDFLTLGLEKSSVLGITDLDPTQNEYVKTLAGTLKKLTMLPRNTFKSTVGNITFIPWLLWHNPNLRIMIDSETLSNSKLYLAGVKDLIDNNARMRMICTNDKGEYILEPNKRLGGGFVEDQVILKHRTKVGLKEPSIFCSGVDNARTGMHPDVILMDDLVSERNVSTDGQLQKVEEHYKYSLSLLEIGGLIVVIGTRYHMADLYGTLIESQALDTLIRPARTDDGELYFPSRLTHEYLADMRKEQGSYIYSCQYMLDPINPDDAIFKKEHVNYIEDLADPPVITDRYITVDPAISKGERADYSIIMTIGVDRNKKRYVEKYRREKFHPNELIDAIFKAAEETVDLRAIGIETVAFQKMLIFVMKDEMRRRGKYLTLRELKADKDKVRRALMIQPAWENDDIYVSRKHKELIRELTEFPFSEHDDTVDALAYSEQMMKPFAGNNKKLRYTYKPGNSVTNY
jgi:predicted phage terminase large subunit-like protein